MCASGNPVNQRTAGSLSPVLHEQERTLRAVMRRFREDVAIDRQTSASQWMLDNYYVVQQAQFQIREDMPAGFYHRLPVLRSGELQSHPRIYAIARELVCRENGLIDANGILRVAETIRAYPDSPVEIASPAALTIAELWALPVMLRLSAMQCLLQAACHVTGIRNETELPDIPLLPSIKDDQAIANAVLTLRALDTQDWQVFFEEVSQVERILHNDPAGAYTAMDKETRDGYRRVIERLARRTGRDEPAIAREVVRLAQSAHDSRPDPNDVAAARRAHVGYYLIDTGRSLLENELGYRPPFFQSLRRYARRYPTRVYLGSIASFTAIVLGIVLLIASRNGALPIEIAAAAILTLIPASSIAIGLINWIVTLALPPRALPKMDFEKGIPAEYAGLVVIPSMLTSTNEINSLLKQVELHYLRNADPNLSFALLTDYPDAAQQNMPGDASVVEQASAGIRALNEKYAPERHGANTPFYLLHRERRWNASEHRWMGWERKRGKLEELNRLLRGDINTTYTVQIGDTRIFRGIRYVITLDADTNMLRQSAQRLVAALAHPLNRAVFNARGQVIAGYTLLQPRTEITPISANRSLFTRIFAGDVGLDLYTHAVSNVYQDLFGTGIYIGKGIYDVDAFERSLRGRIPENALLSHDLFEGIHGRVGLATDIVLLEEYPPHYLVYMRRNHRWIRGDWQLLPWLLPRVPHNGNGTIRNDLSAIERWKILDNLRRSLLAPTLLLTFIAGWFWLPGSTWYWTIFGILTPAVPVIAGALSGLARSILINRRTGRHSLRGVIAPLRDSVLRWLLELAFIPYETSLALTGIAITLVRVVFTRRNMLEWVTAAQAARESGHEISRRVALRRMLTALVMTALLAALIVWMNPIALAPALPLLLAWLFSPEIAFLISLPVNRAPQQLPDARNQVLRKLARRTWLFFEQFVGPEDHWLPPDHFQEAPLGQVTPQTSPTNIGLLLLSTLAAYDFGYVGLQELATRLQLAFESLSKLELHRGHLLNWYDTRSMQPLSPRYISTVDSGNLAGCLIALRQGLQALQRAPLLRWQFWEGLIDTYGLLDDVVGEFDAAGPHAETQTLHAEIAHICERVQSVRQTPQAWIPLLESIASESRLEINQALSKLVAASTGGNASVDPAILQRLHLVSERARSHLEGARREIQTLLPPELQVRGPILELTLDSLPKLRQAPDTPWAAQDDSLANAATAAQALTRTLCDIEAQAERMVQEMDFTFLFDSQRQVFHIGYNIEAARLDNNHYDLLASEARIASLVAIATNDVPASHWLHLSRALTEVDGTRCLLSWSATMFEYLMPALLMRSVDGTLLRESDRAAVQRQIDYGREKRVPWGVSEAGYFAFDSAMNYQYRAFGVPGLGYRREPADELVIAPYASALALRFAPPAVLDNIERLIKEGMLGTHGFYESVDYTPLRLPMGEQRAVIRSYMAHHQGMILLSLVNYLHADVMVNRFHADRRIESVETLLQEKVPYDTPIEAPLADEEALPVQVRKPPAPIPPWRVLIVPPVPQAHFISNGRYGILLTSAGGGYSSWQNLELTRWSPDATAESAGSWLYLQEETPDNRTSPLWSATFQPTAVWPESEHVDFHAHMVEYVRVDRGIAMTLRITVAPDDDVEIRHVSLANHTDSVRRLHVTSYGEVVMSPHNDGQRHPAFNKLFVESEYVADQHTLLFRRRPRTAEEAGQPVYMAHCAFGDASAAQGRYESDRARFLGRGGAQHNPQALQPDTQPGEPPIAGAHALLDPVFSLTETIELPPHGTAQVAFITLVATSRQRALQLAERYRASNVVDMAIMQAAVRARLELDELGIDSAELQQAQQLLSALLYPNFALRAGAATIAANQKAQNGLWAYGISGDNPILLLRLNSMDDLTHAETLLRLHHYWRNRQLKIDLVILNRQGTTYNQELGGALRRLLVRMHSDTLLNRNGGIFAVNADQMSDEDRVLLETSARAIIDPTKGSLAGQLEAMQAQPNRLPTLMPTLPERTDAGAVPEAGITRPAGLLFDNGLGGFSADGHEYVIYLRPGQSTPAPWINVIANPDFGFIVSESGAGYTWAGNSSENRLTPWSNDPVLNAPGEALYLRDEETVEVWSPTPAPCPADAPYLIRHGAGYSRFEHHSHELKQSLRVFAAADDPIKILQLRLENTSGRTRRITATLYLEWVLGTSREVTQLYLVPEYESQRQAMLARNPYSMEFGERVAFAAANLPLHGLTADRASFLGRPGSIHHPDALQRIGLSGRVEAGLDPCVALQVHVDLQPGEAEELHFMLGQGASREEALQLVDRYRDEQLVQKALTTATQRWDGLLNTVQVHTPEPALDLMLNRWLLYAALSCRIWGRSAFYQSGGAFGFRDQLQDVMALLDAAPHLAREHILLAAAHQFEAGDVLHWWHPPSSRGVRTRISDDMLWLPYVAARYVAASGDDAILNEHIAFLKAPPLDKKEEERYSIYPAASETATLLEHCRRAIDRGATAGSHGLPLMGSGDWNDGMNRVGSAGAGESIWLGWFLYAALNQYADLCDLTGNRAEAEARRQQAARLRAALAKNAWDGAWYLRAYYDDGTRLGSSVNSECQIDSIAQSWAALSGAGEPAHVAQAMQAVKGRLVRPTERLVLLFTPPFDKTLRDPGYIKGYAPGVRENGGQYTHAAIWTAWAFAALGDGNTAMELFQLLNPILHADTPAEVDRYKVEPYVIAADVYGAPPHTGRGGWTWYTGSNAWMYRLGLNAILGIQRKGQVLEIAPCIPGAWPSYRVSYRYGQATYEIEVDNTAGAGKGVRSITVDDRPLPGRQIPLLDDGNTHRVCVTL